MKRPLPEWPFHLLIWTLLWLKDATDLYASPHVEIPKTDMAIYGLVSGIYTFILAGAFYGSVYLVARPLLVGRLTPTHYGWALLGVVATFAVITFIRYSAEMQLFKPVFGFDNYDRHSSFTLGWFVRNSVFYYLDFVIYGLLYAFIKRHFINERRQHETEQARTAAELAFLRSQLNPHFLFNTINDIYALVYRKSDDAPDALLKLSELLRYVLHDARHDRVPLAKEVDYLQSLIQLQRIGLKDNLHVQYQLTGPLNGQMIAPLLLVSFVENAFKHGVISDPASPVQIHLDLTETTVDLTLQNRKIEQQKDHMGGIGLANVRRRLELLYPNRHSLHVADQPDTYHVNLHLDL
ncbi:MAG: histidine kinase [Cytophagales bacterium]|nr:MAG: histidine kinase [Cytophagales bacterium]